MKEVIKYFIKLFLFWMIFFFIQRMIFLVYNHENIKGIDFNSVISSSWYALPMDISMTSYILLIPFLLFIILFIKNSILIKQVIFYYFILIIILTAFISIVDLGLFEAWGSKLNPKALSYLAYPEEATDAVKGTPIFLLLGIFIIETVIAIWVFNKIKIPGYFRISPLRKIAISFFLLFLIFTGLRGGLQEIPINKSWSYFSKYPVLNMAALNGDWNAFEIFITPSEYKRNPYSYLSYNKAKSIVDDLHHITKDTTISIFNIERPNIILIMLESWSGDIIQELGGEKGVSPEFSKLCEEGLLFTNFYATGFRTEQGLAALVSGFPSQPKTTIIRKFGKFDKLPSMVNVLDSNGYNSGYYYGGDLDFANTLTYLRTSGFDKITGENNFEINKKTEWGAYDEELFNFYIKDTKTAEQPFFDIIITSTSHEPFDAPVDGGFEGDDLPNRYRNTISYTDRCLGNFIESAKEYPWFKNTVFFITPDHGHFLPLNRKNFEAERHHIPLLIIGGALNEDYKGKTAEQFGSHSDFAATVLAQLGLEHEHFRWSKNLFNPYQKDFAFYTFDEGFGWIEKGQTIIYDHNLGQIIYVLNDTIDKKTNNQYLKKGKAYLQIMMDEYVRLNSGFVE